MKRRIKYISDKKMTRNLVFKILLEFDKKCASSMQRSHWSKVEADHCFEVKNSHFVDDFTFH